MIEFLQRQGQCLALRRRPLAIAGTCLVLCLTAFGVDTAMVGAVNPSEPSASHLVAVEGLLRLDGQPLDGAVVMLIPAEITGGRSAFAWTSPDGKFRLKTPSLGLGVLPEKYKIVVAPRGRSRHEDVERPTRATRIPRYYRDLDTTPLTCTVPPPRQLTLTLKSDTAP